MLTMLPVANKQAAIAEYFRVLKPGGVLLTHDVVVSDTDSKAIVERLRDTIKVKVTPLTESGWQDLFRQGGFADLKTLRGGMTLLSPAGLIHDERLAAHVQNHPQRLESGNRATFKRMFRTFNDPAQSMGFIAVCSRKPS